MVLDVSINLDKLRIQILQLFTMTNGYKSILFTILVTGLFGMIGCGPNNANNAISPSPEFAKGADVGWITEMEAAGIKFYNSSGEEKECMELLKEKGINSIRLRAWVNPTDGWNNTKDLVIKSKRVKNLGMKLMIDFHYSDTWADPAHQPIPSAWAKMPYGEMKNALHNYTKQVMDTLKQNGITPEWVQIGNETNDGMLWEEGRASKSMVQFAGFIQAGYAAVKSVSSSTQVIVHLSNGHDNGLFRWMFDGLKANGASWDIIGMSLYPFWAPDGVDGWSTTNNKCLNNMNDMIARYNTPVMIVEVGMPANQPEKSKAFLIDIIKKTKDIPNGKGLGVFYWEPQCYKKWKGYELGAFDDSGKPSIAMDAFLKN
jgi:arabinogalactan endo-1,4-beta-galactosidase